MFYVTRIQSGMDHTLFSALRQSWTVPSCQNDIWLYGSLLFPMVECPPWRQLLIMLIPLCPGDSTMFPYMHHVEVVADQDPASGSFIYKQTIAKSIRKLLDCTVHCPMNALRKLNNSQRISKQNLFALIKKVRTHATL